MKGTFLINKAMDEIFKQKVIHLFLILCIAMCTYYLNYTMTVLSTMIRDIVTVSSFRDREIILVNSSQNVNIENQDLDSKKMYKRLRDSEYLDISYTTNTTVNVNDVQYNAYVYGKNESKNVKLLLSEGQNMYQYKGSNLPILLTDNHPLLETFDVGDAVEILITYRDTYRNKIKVNLSCEICGVLEYPYRYYVQLGPHAITSNALNLDYEPMVILPDFEVEGTSTYLEVNYWNKSLGEHWYVDVIAEEGTAEYEEAIRLLNGYRFYPMKNYIKSCVQESIEYCATEIIMFFGMLLLVIVCIGSANLYIGKKQMRSFAIYFISGAKWKDCLFIDVFRNLIVIIIPTVLGFVVSSIYVHSVLINEYTSYYFSWSNLWVILALVTVIFLISSLPYIIKLKNTEPITFVRTMNKE